MTETLLVQEDCFLRIADSQVAYIDRILEVPAGVSRLTVRLTYEKVVDKFQLYAALIDPHGVLRGHVQCPGPAGPRDLRFTIAEDDASPGCIPGGIEQGRWTLRVDLDRFRESGPYSISVMAEIASESAPRRQPPDSSRPAAQLLGGGCGQRDSRWLKGELHSHSVHSDGRDGVRDMLREVQRLGFDFWALSDHFTWSHWLELAALQEAGESLDVLLLPSIEVTTHEGHSNVHGCAAWPDVYVDGPGTSAGALADTIHQERGVVCVNHPFSGPQAWRRADISWSQVDLMEVVNHGQLANNDAAIALWDRLLAEGHDIAPVAGTDCHSIHDPQQLLGELVTFIFAEQRSVEGLLVGLRACRTVVSRGSFLDLQLSGSFGLARLGETVEGVTDQPVDLTITIDTQFAGTVFVIRDGLMWHTSEVDPGNHRIQIRDDHPVSGAYRVELHRSSTDPLYDASCLRSHSSFEALTSFIRLNVIDPRRLLKN